MLKDQSEWGDAARKLLATFKEPTPEEGYAEFGQRYPCAKDAGTVASLWRKATKRTVSGAARALMLKTVEVLKFERGGYTPGSADYYRVGRRYWAMGDVFGLLPLNHEPRCRTCGEKYKNPAPWRWSYYRWVATRKCDACGSVIHWISCVDQ